MSKQNKDSVSIKFKLFLLITQLSFSIFLLSLIYSKPSVLYYSPEFLYYLYISILNSIHSMYFCIKLLFDIEENPGPFEDSDDEIEYYFGVMRVPEGTPIINIQAHEHNVVHCDPFENFDLLVYVFNRIMLRARAHDSNYYRLYAYSLASYVYYPNRYAQSFFVTFDGNTLQLNYTFNHQTLLFSSDLEGSTWIHYNGISIDYSDFDSAIIHVFRDYLDLQPETRDDIVSGNSFLDCTTIASLVANDNPDVIAILLMHDIELNPGPFNVVQSFYDTERIMIQLCDTNLTQEKYLDMLRLYRKCRLVVSIRRDTDDNIPEEIYTCLDRMSSMLVEAHTELYMKGIKLMFDIETNPGPQYLDLLALYMDCMNYAATIKDDAFILKYHPDLVSRFTDIELLYLHDDSLGCIEIMRHIKDYLFMKPQMMSSLNPLTGIAQSLQSISDSVKNAKLEVGVDAATIEGLTGIATKFSEINVGIDASTKDFLTPKVPDILNLTNVFLWLQSPKNASCSLSIVIAILLVCRKRYPGNSSLISLCSVFGVIGLLYLNSATIISVISAWVFPTNVTQSDDSDWVSVIAEILSFGFFSRSITFKDSESFGRSISAAEKHARGLSDYIDRLKSIISKIVAKLSETFGIELSTGFSTHADKIKSFSRRLMILKLDPATFDGEITFTFSQSVKKLEDDINAYIAKLSPTKENSTYHVALRNALSLMNPLLALVRNSHIKRVHRRTPFNINMVGPSGVGKTQLANAVIPLVYAHQVTAADLERTKNNGMFAMAFVPDLSGKFYDTYDGQFCWLFNDFLQRLEAEGAQQSDIILFIQMLGSSPLPLNCAEITKKGLMMFVSDFIVTSMNAYRITLQVCKVLTHLDALIRRINGRLNCLVTVKPEYRALPTPEAGVVYPYPDPKFYSKLDETKAMALNHPNGINTDVYVFDEWDSGTGQYKVGGFRNYNFNQYMSELQKRYDAHIAHQDKMNSQTALFMERVSNERLAELQAEAEHLHLQSDIFEYMPALTEDENLEDYIQSLDVETTNINENLLGELSLDIHKYEESNKSILLNIDDDITLYGWIKHYIDICIKDNVRYLIGPEYGYFKEKHNPYNRFLSSANWVDLYYLSFIPFSDNIIIHALRLRSRFDSIQSATYILSLSYMNSFSTELTKFKINPLLWLQDNPYLGMLGIISSGAIAVSMYATLSMLLNWSFKIFNFDPIEKSLCTHQTDCPCEIETPFSTQSSTKIDASMDFMRKPLYNYFQIRLRASNILLNKFIEVSPSQGFAIADYTFEMPYHVLASIDLFKLRKGVVKIELGMIPVNTRLTTPPEWFNIEDLTFDRSCSSIDACRVTLPISQPKFPCLKRYLPPCRSELLKLIQSREFLSGSAFVIRSGILSREKVKLSYSGKLQYQMKNTMIDPLASTTLVIPSVDVSIEHSLKIHFPTIEGDCYMAVFIDDPILKTLTSCEAMLQNPIMCYRHLIGNESVGIGYGALTFREDYEKVSSSGLKCPQLLLEEDAELRKLKLEEVLKSMQHNTTEMITPVPDPPKHLAQHHPIQVACTSVPLSRNNAISRSELFKDIKSRYGLTKMPVALYPTVDGDPMVIARDAYGSNLNYSINYKAAFIIADDVVNEIFTNSGPILHTRVYTIKEVLEGVPEEGIRSNDRSTSWGYQLKALASVYGFSSADLRWAFGTGDKYEYDSNFAKLVLSLCAHYDITLQEGIDFAHIYMDCLKAECKDSTKARLFCACDKIFLLKCKQYFGGFANWIYVNRIKNGIAIGINPYSEWDIFYRWLTEFTKHGVFGDYGKYDKRQVSILMFVTKLAIRQYYAGCPEPENIAREILFEKFVKTLHVALEKDIAYIYEWFHGNTSGNLLTAIINSITGLFIVKYCCCDILLLDKGGIDAANGSNLTVMLKILRKQTRVITYGDDNGIMIHKNLQDRINFYTLQASITKCFNLEYTDEQKGKRIGYEIPNHTHIFDATFIARAFREESGRIVAPLREVSLFEPLAWYKNTKDPEELVRGVERVLKECSARGSEYFYKHQPFLSDICIKRLHTPPRFQLWEAAFAAFLSEESLYFDPSFIYGHLDLSGFTSILDADESIPNHPKPNDNALKVSLISHF